MSVIEEIYILYITFPISDTFLIVSLFQHKNGTGLKRPTFGSEAARDLRRRALASPLPAAAWSAGGSGVASSPPEASEVGRRTRCLQRKASV